METNETKKTLTNYDKKMQQKNKKGAAKKLDWTTWLIIAIVAVFIIVVACTYFIKKYNSTSKTYFKVGNYDISSTEYNYYFNTIANSFISNNSDYLLYIGLDTSKPLDEQTCLYDANLTWKDYFDESAAPLIQAVKAVVDDANAKGFEYDVTEDYNSYLESVKTQAASQNLSVKKFYQNTYGRFATEKRLAPVVKEYLLYQAYYKQLEEDNKVQDGDVQAEYEANPEQYDTIDYRLFSLVADIADDATDEEKTAAMDTAEEKANEMVERFKAGEDWRELCYEYVAEAGKDNYDPSKESDPTVIAGSNKTQISQNYSEWLYDDSRKADDVMVYRDESNKACFVIVFDKKTPYDVEADASDIAGTLATKKVTEYIEGLTANYEITDKSENLKYLHIAETETTAETDTAETTGAQESTTAAADENQATSETSAE